MTGIEGKRALWLMTQARITDRLVFIAKSLQGAVADATELIGLDPVLLGDVVELTEAINEAMDVLTRVSGGVAERIKTNIQEHASG